MSLFILEKKFGKSSSVVTLGGGKVFLIQAFWYLDNITHSMFQFTRWVNDKQEIFLHVPYLRVIFVKGMTLTNVGLGSLISLGEDTAKGF